MSKIYLLLLTGIMFAAVANGQINYFSKAAATDFTDVNSWGTNADGTGTSPASITSADNYTIQNASVMNLNAGNAAVRTLTINAGSLTIGSNTLTVAIAAQFNSILTVNSGGTLSVNGGTLNINGNVIISSGATFNQSAGSIVVDGNNGGSATNSVVSGTIIFSILSNLGSVTGGSITIVDPPAAGTARSFAYSSSIAQTWGTGHTLFLGDGVSADASTATNGFEMDCFISSARLLLGNVTVQGGSAANRWAGSSSASGNGTMIGGNLTINSGSEFRNVSAGAVLILAGNLTNNGTYTALTGLTLATIVSNATAVNPNAQTIGGSGVYRNLVASPTANFTSLTINNSNASGVTFSNANSLLSGAVTGTVSGTLTFTAGLVNTGSNSLILGTGTGALGTLAYTAGGFMSGSTFGRWYATGTAGTTISASTLPTVTGTTGSYPFLVGVNARNFFINRPATTGSTGGIISVQHTDGAGLNTIGAVVDGAYSIDRQSVANWTVTTSGGFAAGTGTFSYAVSGQGTFSITNGNARLMKVATVVGTHQAGTSLPHAQRTTIAAADYTGTFYLGLSSTDIPIVTAQSGPWEDVNTWAGGIVPACGNNAAILNGHTVTVNAAAANTGNLVINTGGTLTVSGNTLTVGCTNNNNSLTNNGTLNVSGGVLNVNGNIISTAGSTFSQTGGDINVNGNSGTVGTSVLTGTPLIQFQSNLLTLSGGKLTIVTGHIGTATADRVITYSPSATPYPLITTAHTVQFGDGVTTTANSTKGFEITTGTRFYFGNVIMNSIASANAFFASNTATCIVNGDLTITNGDFRGGTTTQYIGGNIVNNGTLTNTGTLYFGQVTQANMSSPTPSAATVAQTVSGSGVFRNLTASPTANFTSININNTSASGVTFSNANSLLSGANTGTASGTLTLTNGYVNTGSNAFVLGISAASTGTLAYTAGGFASGSTFSRWWGTATGGATITAGSTPSGTAAGVYPFAIGTAPSFTARNLYLNQTAVATAGGKIAVTYNDVAGTSAAAIVDGAYTVDVRSNGSWVVSQTGITGTPTYTMAINAQNLYNAANGNSRVTLAAAPATGVHQNGSTYPNAQRITVPLASLGDTYYIGINGADVPFISVANGAWETPATWNKNAVPTSADAVIIANSTTVTVNATAAAASILTVTGIVNVTGSTLDVTAAATGTGVTVSATTGQLNISGGTVTIGTGANRYSSLTDNGTLSVSGTGTLNLNGNLVVAAAAIFSQSGGNINVDGNAAGVVANSVPSATHLVNIAAPSTNVTFSGGTFTIVDPSTSTGQYAVYINNASSTPINASLSHTFRFGDGASADAGSTDGFYADLWESNTNLAFGNLVIGGQGSNAATRYFKSVYSLVVSGDLTVNSGGEFRPGVTTHLAGNFTVNTGGIASMTNTLTLDNYDLQAGTSTPVTAAQTIGGAGTYQNLTASPTANLTSLSVNNTNATGVTLTKAFSVSGTLTLTTGVINTTTTNLLTLGTATAAGTLSGGSATAYINGPFARTFAASRTASGTYDATTLFPVAKGTSYLPIHIDPTTTAGGAVVLRGEAFTSNTGTAGAGVTTLSSNRWEALVTSGGANFTNSFIRLNDATIAATNKILQSSSAAGSYSGIPAASTYAASTLTSATAIPTASYTGYFAYGDLTACTAPADQPTVFTTSLLGATSFTGSFTAAASTPSNYLVVRYLSPATETLPSDFTTYTPGGALGAGTIVSISGATTFNETGLTAGTAYSYYIYSYNNSACAGPVYRTASPLTGNVTTCAAVTGVPGTPTSNAITSSSFTATWTASSTPSVTYELDVATDNAFTSFVTGYNALNVGAVLTYNVNTNLNPNTTYYVRVRAVLTGCYSVNSGTLTVTTSCINSALPLSEGFNTAGTSAFPTCWTQQTVVSTSNITFEASSSNPTTVPYEGSRYVFWNAYSISAGNETRLVSPPVTTTGTASVDVEFRWYNENSTSYNSGAYLNEGVQVQYSLDGTTWIDAGALVARYDGTLASGTGQWNLKTITLPAGAGNQATIYVGFKFHSEFGDNCSLDAATIKATPACPVPTAVSVVSLTGTTASVSFSPAGSNFIVEYGAPGFTPGTAGIAGVGGTIAPGGSSPVSLTGLTAGTSYDVYVRQICAGPAYSANTSVVTFSTACAAATVPYLEDFESITAPAVPACFRVEDLNGNTTWTGFNGDATTASSGTKSIVYSYNTPIGANDWFFVRAITLTGGTSYRLKFKYKASDGPTFIEQMEVKYGTSRSAASMTLGTLFTNTNINNALADPFLEGITDFTPATTGEYYIGFHSTSIADQAYLLVDDISVDVTPACAPPTSVAVGSVTAATASVTFTSAGSNFIVEYGAPGFTPGTAGTPGAGGTIVTGSASPIALSSLTAATTYDVYVRQVCAGPSYGANTTVVTFTTLCDAVNVPYSENFDAVTAPAVPTCITVTNNNADAYQWRTATGDEASSPNSMYMRWNSSLAMNDWFFLPGFNLTGGTSYRLVFQYKTGGGYIEKLNVMYGSGPSAGSMTNTIVDFNNLTNSTYQTATYDFTPSSTGVYYIGFQGYSDADQFTLFVDDVSLDLTPACAPPTGITVLATSATSASVSFTPVGAGNDFIVEYGPVGFTPGTGATAGAGGTVVTGNAGSPVAVTGIALTDTTLDVYVRKVCAGPSYSTNSTVVKFLRNDDAAGALTLTLGAACSGATYTNVNATKSTNEVDNTCSGTVISPVWFKFVAPASGAVRISTDAGAGNTFTDSKVALFSATDPTNYGTFNIISCDDDGGSVLGSGFMSVLYATGLTAGNTYYVAVDKFTSTTTNGIFCITVDELASSMLAASSSCSSLDYQSPSSNGNTTYTGWVPLLDQFSNLVALVQNTAGGAADAYSFRQTISGIDRTDATSGQQYLRRNFAINNSGSVSNVDVQLFFLNSELTALQGADAAVTLANLGVTRQTGTTCQADFVAANGTNSFIPQTGNGTSADGLAKWVKITTPGFSNFYLHTSKAPVTVKTFLQGAYLSAGSHKNVSNLWASVLNNNALNQPYSVAPFNYAGTESVAPSFFGTTNSGTDILDWVLLELRNAATPSIIVKQRAAFIRVDGRIVDLDKVSSVSFRGVANGSYYITIRHRNHLDIRTGLVQVVDGALGSNPAPALYDFSNLQNQAYQNTTIAPIPANTAMKDLGSGVFGMWAGNVNPATNTTVNYTGLNADALALLGLLLSNQSGNIGGAPLNLGTYSRGDLNLNGVVNYTGLNSDGLFLLGILSANQAGIIRQHVY